jgi:hypothetical protein
VEIASSEWVKKSGCNPSSDRVQVNVLEGFFIFVPPGYGTAPREYLPSIFITVRKERSGEIDSIEMGAVSDCVDSVAFPCAGGLQRSRQRGPVG